MRAEPFPISRTPQGYVLTLPTGQTVHRFKRQALSYAKLAAHPRQPKR